MYYLGFDIGSSSIKAALVDGESGKVINVVQYPQTEMEILSRQPGWAEQHPEDWWKNTIQATHRLLQDQPRQVRDQIIGIGISYQMHGLVLIDEKQKVLRPSIIWCDGRAVETGNEALTNLGEEKCYLRLLNAPGNFTASKLKWVRDNEPEVYARVDKILLPGDYIAMKLTGKVSTTAPGLSEGIMWDFHLNEPASFIFKEFGLEESMIPDVLPTFSIQGNITTSVASSLGISPKAVVGYRAGDQPNNAMSLGVLQPGQIAATGGTSGVVYGVMDQPIADSQGRVNCFAHVNHSADNPRIGVLLCINGAGIQYRWIKQQMASDNTSYADMERLISSVPINSDGLRIIPFGNGAERILMNRDVGSHVMNLHFNRHNKTHFYRASLEGVAFSFIYGMEILSDLGMEINTLKVGNDNLFQSDVFASTVATLLNREIEIIDTTGAIGAARALAYSLGHVATIEEAMAGNEVVKTVGPLNVNGAYKQGYGLWKNDLKKLIEA